MPIRTTTLVTSLVSTNHTVQTSEKSKFRHAYGPEEAGLEIIYLVVTAAVPGQPRTPLEALPTGGAAKSGVSLLMDSLVVPKEAGQSESLSTGCADMPLLLRVDTHVVAEGHVVGVRLVTIGAVEVANFVCIFVVEQTASMLV